MRCQSKTTRFKSCQTLKWEGGGGVRHKELFAVVLLRYCSVAYLFLFLEDSMCHSRVQIPSLRFSIMVIHFQALHFQTLWRHWYVARKHQKQRHTHTNKWLHIIKLSSLHKPLHNSGVQNQKVPEEAKLTRTIQRPGSSQCLGWKGIAIQLQQVMRLTHLRDIITMFISVRVVITDCLMLVFIRHL